MGHQLDYTFSTVQQTLDLIKQTSFLKVTHIQHFIHLFFVNEQKRDVQMGCQLCFTNSLFQTVPSVLINSHRVRGVTSDALATHREKGDTEMYGQLDYIYSLF